MTSAPSPGWSRPRPRPSPWPRRSPLAAPTTAARESGSDDFTIRVAMGSTGKAVDSIFTTLKEQYEEKYPGSHGRDHHPGGRHLRDHRTQQPLDLTQRPRRLLRASRAPGSQTKVDDGYGADISEAVSQPAFTDRIRPTSAYSGMVIDGKTYMVPWSGDVTNVFWYNEDVFAANNLTPPTTWAEFMDVCATLKAAGITPLIDGNKDKWPVGSIASHLAERRSATTPTSPRSWVSSR